MNLGTIFQEFLSSVETDGKAILPLLGPAVVQAAENPTKAGVIMAGVQLLEGAVGVVEPQIAQGLASVLQTEFNSLITKAVATPAKKA